LCTNEWWSLVDQAKSMRWCHSGHWYLFTANIKQLSGINWKHSNDYIHTDTHAARGLQV